MENLKGFAISHLRPKQDLKKVTWNAYSSVFRVAAGRVKGRFSIKRTLDVRAVSAEIEKRRRGDGRPLSQEVITVTALSRVGAKCCDDGARVVRRRADMLPAVIIRPLQPASVPQWTLIYLHGMGSSALGNYGDRPHFFLDGSVALKVIVPTAPSREVSCYDSWWSEVPSKRDASGKAWRLAKFLSWYDYLTDHDGKREDDLDIESLLAMRRALHEIVRREAAALGGRFDRIILGGKSQGCATALDAALTFEQPLGGFVGLVGHLLASTPVEVGGPQARAPFHFFHEREDKTMRWKWVQSTEQRLRDAGYHVRARHGRDPEGNAHNIGGVEGRWLRSALAAICK